MTNICSVFQRREMKYRLDARCYELFRQRLDDRIAPDEYGHNLVCTLYFDTPDFLLVNRSLEKPLYKEKLRVRSYGVPHKDDAVFVEIKKKFKGIVYKRRIIMSHAAAREYLFGLPFDEAIKRYPLPESGETMAASSFVNKQIASEIDWFRTRYSSLEPAVFISSERDAYVSVDDPTLRFTFDTNVLWRENHLDLAYGVEGSALLKPGERLMEIKATAPFPLWLAALLSELNIKPVSFSKYGSAYIAANTPATWRVHDGKDDSHARLCFHQCA